MHPEYKRSDNQMFNLAYKKSSSTLFYANIPMHKGIPLVLLCRNKTVYMQNKELPGRLKQLFMVYIRICILLSSVDVV